ncbi:MAG: chemotaxis protein CheD [Pseudomonadota bacterium]
MAAELKLGRARNAVHVVQGEFAVSSDPDVMFTTVLGSCIATCLYDAGAGIGGMNHFLLPDSGSKSSSSNSFGVNAMELLINAMLKDGARRKHLEAKIFGGAAMITNVAEIGKRNTEFARRFLSAEGIPIVSESVGGTRARRIQFWPADGRARQKQMPDANVREIEPVIAPVPMPAQPAGDVELF